MSPTAMAAGGAALARDADGRVVRGRGPAAERVRARITDARKDFARAVAVEIADPSPGPGRPAVPGAGRRLRRLHVAARLGRRPGPSQGRRRGRRPSAHRRSTNHPCRTSLPMAGSRCARPPAWPSRPVAGPGTVRAAAPAQSPANSCLVVHPLLEELIVAGRYPGAGEVLLRVAVASGERMVLVDRNADRRAGARRRGRVPGGRHTSGLRPRGRGRASVPASPPAPSSSPARWRRPPLPLRSGQRLQAPWRREACWSTPTPAWASSPPCWAPPTGPGWSRWRTTGLRWPTPA
ncbi:MAG: hypothetical protein WKG07_46095 [Hymenobacter sp.]